MFIEFSLQIILDSFSQFSAVFRPRRAKKTDRIELSIDFFGNRTFTRKDYLEFNKGISTATASRDLALAVKNKLLAKSGDKTTATYRKV